MLCANENITEWELRFWRPAGIAGVGHSGSAQMQSFEKFPHGPQAVRNDLSLATRGLPLHEIVADHRSAFGGQIFYAPTHARSHCGAKPTIFLDTSRPAAIETQLPAAAVFRDEETLLIRRSSGGGKYDHRRGLLNRPNSSPGKGVTMLNQKSKASGSDRKRSKSLREPKSWLYP